MKTVLIIAYYFPPLGSGGAQRPIKFAKYLPEKGWQAVILTVRGGFGFTGKDATQLEEIAEFTRIYRAGSVEPSKMGIIKKIRFEKRFHPETGESQHSYSLLYKIFRAIRNLVFIPDEHIGWLPFAFLKGLSVAKREKVDLILATSPPITDFFVGYLLSLFLGKPLVVDFREQWTQFRFRPQHTRVREAVENWLERKVLSRAQEVVSVTPPITEEFKERYKSLGSERFLTITNGFDPKDFEDWGALEQDDKFTITYTGGFYYAHSPQFFLEALYRLLNERPYLQGKIRVVLVGTIEEVYERMVQELKLQHNVEVVGYVPHKESIRYLLSSDAALLILGKHPGSGIAFPVKLFNYLAADKYILALIPEGISADLIRSAGGGMIVDPESIEEIKEGIYSLYLKWKDGELKVDRDPETVRQYDYKVLTQRLALVLDEATQ